MNLTIWQVIVLLIILAVLLSSPGLLSFYWVRRYEVRERVKQQGKPDLIAELERAMVSNQTRMDAIEKARQTDHAQLMRLNVELGRVGIRLERWMSYAQRLIQIMRDADLPVPQSPDEMDEAALLATANANPEDESYDTAALLRRMTRAFDTNELRDLAFQLKVDTGELGGETFNAQARALITNVQRRGRLAELVALCRQLRPDGKF